MEKFQHVDTWLFDLDNTLYNADHGVFDRMMDRINLYVAGHLQITQEQASELRRTYWEKYGTTLRGMMEEHDIDPDAFLWYTHDIDISDVPQCLITNEGLSRLPGRKIIYTNAAHEFAERMTTHLGIRHHFEAIFSIEDAKYISKPEISSYNDLIKTFNIDPKRTAMFEDTAVNLKTAAGLGMTTVWIHGRNDPALHVHPHIHHTAETLAAWMQKTIPQHPYKKDR